MNRKKYWITNNKYLIHNFMLIKTIEDVLKIISLSFYDNNGEEIFIITKPIIVNHQLILRYDILKTNKILVEIEHDLVNILDINNLLKISVGLSKYKTIGHYKSESNTITFNKYLNIVHEIENLSDSYIDLKLNLQTYDIYDNLLYTASNIPLSINNNGFLIQPINDRKTLLYYEPELTTAKIIIDKNILTNENFKIEKKYLLFDNPLNYDSYIIYKPAFVHNATLIQYDSNINITPTYELILKDNYCSKIKFVIELTMYNTNITNINSTPIIKKLGLITTDR